MIKVFKLYSAPPEILNSSNCQEKKDSAIEAFKANKKYSFSTYYYRHKKVIEALEKIYNEKCGYCESKTKHVASLQVEHYRPKGGVDENPTHKGYYWLGYEWSNLLLACPKCNGKEAKGNKFPISGVRVSVHSSKSLADKSPLINEEPLLLNPEIDNPREHFIFDAYGKIDSNTTRGIKTIEICKLDRDKLNIMRRAEIINDIIISIKDLILAYVSKTSMPEETFLFMLKNIFDNLEKKKNPSHSYSLLGWYMFDNFDKFVRIHIHNTFQEKIIEVWNRYIDGEL